MLCTDTQIVCTALCIYILTAKNKVKREKYNIQPRGRKLQENKRERNRVGEGNSMVERNVKK